MAAAHLNAPSWLALPIMGTAKLCTGKVAFISPTAAARLLHHMDRRRRGRAVYRCESCGLWHIAGRSQQMRRPRADAPQAVL